MLSTRDIEIMLEAMIGCDACRRFRTSLGAHTHDVIHLAKRYCRLKRELTTSEKELLRTYKANRRLVLKDAVAHLEHDHGA